MFTQELCLPTEHDLIDHEAAGCQGDPIHQQTAGGQEAAGQQHDNAMDEDPADPAVQRYRQAKVAIAQLKSEAGVSGQQSALQTLSTILQVFVQMLCFSTLGTGFGQASYCVLKSRHGSLSLHPCCMVGFACLIAV